MNQEDKTQDDDNLFADDDGSYQDDELFAEDLPVISSQKKDESIKFSQEEPW